MSDVTLKNNETHQITLHLRASSKDTVKTVKIPAATQGELLDGRGKAKKIPGTAEVDGDLLADSRKWNKGVDAFFTENLLTIDEKKKSVAVTAPAPIK
jgi:hypothetical protein